MERTRADRNEEDINKLRHALVSHLMNGRSEEVRASLESCCQRLRQVLTSSACAQGITCCNLLFYAADVNASGIIEYLVRECDADLEVKCNLTIFTCYTGDIGDRDSFLDAITPLVQAVLSTCEESVRTLVSLGADVKFVAPVTGYTVLHFACSANNPRIVQTLLESGLCQQTAGKHGVTPLMLAVYNKNADVCRLLLENGADVHAANSLGNTALHLAARANSVEVATVLLQHGANPRISNKYYDDVLRTAAFNRSAEALNFLYPNYPCSARKVMECYLLFGAATLDQIEYAEAITHVRNTWTVALTVKEQHQIIDDETAHLPNPVYDGAVMPRTVAELNEILDDFDATYMQGLLLRETILGPAHTETIAAVLRHVKYFIADGQFGRGIRLARHGFVLCRQHWSTYHEGNAYHRFLRKIDIAPTVEIDRKDIESRRIIAFDDVLGFLETVVTELNNRSKFDSEESTFCMTLALHLILWFLHLKTDVHENLRFKKSLYNFIKLNLRTFDDRSLLFHVINTLCKQGDSSFPLKIDAINLILKCGADVSEIDREGNSALNCLRITTRQSQSEGTAMAKEELKQVAELLLSAGVHLDQRNTRGSDAVRFVNWLGINPTAHVTLQCLAARVIRQFNIPCLGKLPKHLCEFVDMH